MIYFGDFVPGCKKSEASVSLPHFLFFNLIYSDQEMDWVGQEEIALLISSSVLPVGLVTVA